MVASSRSRTRAASSRSTPTTTGTSSRPATGSRPARRSRRWAAPAARRPITCTSRSVDRGATTPPSTSCRSRLGLHAWRRRTTIRPMSDEAHDVIPDEPLDTLPDEVDEDVRDETRETSRENLRVYLKEIARIPLLTREQEVELARRARAEAAQPGARARAHVCRAGRRPRHGRRAGGGARGDPPTAGVPRDAAEGRGGPYRRPRRRSLSEPERRRRRLAARARGPRVGARRPRRERGSGPPPPLRPRWRSARDARRDRPASGTHPRACPPDRGGGPPEAARAARGTGRGSVGLLLTPRVCGRRHRRRVRRAPKRNERQKPGGATRGSVPTSAAASKA